MRVYNNSDPIGDIRIRPEGWTDDLILETDGLHSCGQAEYGMGVRLGKEKGGGVFTNDDLIEIARAIDKHFSKLAEYTKSID